MKQWIRSNYHCKTCSISFETYGKRDRIKKYQNWVEYQSEVDAEEARSRNILKFLFNNWHKLSGKVFIWYVCICMCMYVCADPFTAEMVDMTKINLLCLSHCYFLYLPSNVVLINKIKGTSYIIGERKIWSFL